MLDAFLGEILVTCEKLRWVIDNFEAVLKPDYRSLVLLLVMFYSKLTYVGASRNPLLLLHKQSKVVYEPIGTSLSFISSQRQLMKTYENLQVSRQHLSVGIILSIIYCHQVRLNLSQSLD